MSKIRRQLIFTGRVQGVGFRYRSLYLAQTYNLTGWVKNLWDGRVQMQVQGETMAILKMVEALRTQRFIEIEDIEWYVIPLEEEERSFKVR